MDTYFCLSCRTDVLAEIESRSETFPVRGEDIEVETQVAVCSACGEDLSVEQLDESALRAAFAEYRRRHELLSPEEIVAIRTKYDLSQRAFSLVLGWGEITAHRYEMGSIQDAAHDAQLRIAAYPRNMAVLLSANGDRLTTRQRSRLSAALSRLQEDATTSADGGWPFVAQQQPDEFNGFCLFSPEKFTEMVVFFAAAPSVFRTKLNKLLFYADFLHFKDAAVSISGTQYVALQRGPVPRHSYSMVERLEEQGDIQTVEWSDGERSGEIFQSTRAADLRVFSDSERRVLDFVREHLALASSQELSDRSHREAAYVRTRQKDVISYLLASELSLSL